MRTKYFILCLAAVLMSASASAQIKLPKLVSDGMVLQRNAGVTIWGWAAADEKVSIHFNDSVYRAVANGRGEWEVTLWNMTAGGPRTMDIMASDTVTVRNIVVGDVWVCSGQSNMELPMSRVRPIYGSEIANSEYPDIRQFVVPQKYNFTAPQHDLQSGSWKAANPVNVLGFSAAAYFFAKELYEKHHVPIGLINASLGGSPAEAWISEESLKKFPTHYAEAQKYKDSTLIVRTDSLDKSRFDEWYSRLRQKDEGFKTGHMNWSAPELNTSDWQVMKIPGYWNTTQLGPVNGVVWFRKEISIPAAMVGQPATLILGRIVDADSVFINGTFAGTTSYQYPPRRYTIPSTLLKAGKNIIVVRVISNSGNGGFVADKPYAITAGAYTVDLKGDWQYRLGATMEPLGSQTFIRWKPLGLYNAMLSPLIKYRIKGVIWYQGESNAGRPLEYRELFPALIRDWRSKWDQGDFPFVYVQLPNFMDAKKEPSESNWALLREAQLKALSVPNTGMAVAIDIGEWNDIHPLNKKDIGKRLARAAERAAYGDTNTVHSGPIYESMRIDGGKIIISFASAGKGLIAKGSRTLAYFSIAGSDGKFVFAKTRIGRNTVTVWHDTIRRPVAVRYAWADNPQDANLYNKEGLPASPFRTDDWTSK